MNLSLNEVEAMARKAARGAGYDWGLAEEASKAARWLCSRNMDGCAILARWLDEADGQELEDLRPVSLNLPWRGRAGRLCPISAGAALSDCAGQLRSSGLQLDNLHSPLLLLPYAAAAAGRLGAPLRIDWDSKQAIVSAQGDVSITADMAAETCANTVQILIAEASPSQTPIQTRAIANDRDWEILNGFAGRTYAPNTEESRRLGAGGGMTDSE